MAGKEQENFCRNAILIVDHAKDSLVDVLELHLTLKSLSFEDFINLHQHDIYHLCFNKKSCCQCPAQGYVSPLNRVLYPSQLEILLDKNGVKRPCHNPKKSADFCCCLAKPGVTTNVLDITLARCLLISFCDDVFWHSCLTLRTNTLEDFLNQNQHQLYHRCAFVKTPCCRCPPGCVFPDARPLLNLHQWNFLFNALALPCALHQNIHSPNICRVFASSGIAVIDLSKCLSRTILEQCCSLWKSINTLLQMRNDVGHAKEGRITDANYRICNNKIGSAILDIAKVCGNETEKKQILMDLEKRSLDETLCIQYQNTLLEQIARERQFEKKLDELTEKITEIEKAVVKTFDGDTKQKLTKDQQIRKEKLKEDADSCIQTHITEETFVKTNLISEGLQKLNENGIVILTGIPGIGKSQNSLELLRAFCTENQGYSAISLPKRSEWSALINADDNLIVLIDDVFGRTNNTFDGNEDLKLLDIIYSTIQKGTVRVILTMRNTIKLALSDVVDSHRMLKAVHFLDISSDRLQMTTDEKKACLLNLCKKNNIWEQKSPTEKINSDDIAILDPDVPVYLSREQIQDIAEINVCPLLGFPESCYLFAFNRKFTGQGVAFFKHPTQTLCDEISNIRTSGKHDDSKVLEYATLVYIMLNGDCFDRLKINCEKVKKVIELIFGPSRIELTTMKIKKCVDLLMGRYLKLKEDNTVCFQHRTIFESVLLSFKDDDPELVIPLLDEECLLELGCLEKYKPLPGEVTFKFYSESYKQLASQLVTYLKLESSPDDFIKALCSSRIIRYGDKSMLEEFYNAYKNNKVDFYVRMMWLEAMQSDRYFCMEVERDCPYKEVPFFILLKYMLRYSINFTDNTNVIIDILDLVSKEMNVCNDICVKKRYTCCFTDVLLQSCNSNNIERLNAILNLIKTRRIKLDKKIISLFDTKRIQVYTLKLLVTTLKDCELINVNVLMKRVVALDDVSLVYFIIEQYNRKSYDIQSAMKTACVKGAVNIVRWFCEHFGVSVFDMQSLLLTVCKRGHIQIVKYLLDKLKYKMFDLDAARSRLLLLTACEHGHIEIVKLLLDNLEHKMFDLDAAMKVSMKNDVNIAHFLLTSSTNHSFKVKEIMDTIPQHCYLSNGGIHKDCLILVKYLLETCSISNFDQKVVIQIAGSSRDSDILQLVFQMMDINDFYQTWIKAEHFENHRTIVLERLFGSGCCTDKDVLTLMKTEMRHHNINGIKYLMKTFDWKYFDIKTVIEYSFCGGHVCSYSIRMLINEYLFSCSHGDSEFLLWMLKTFGHRRFDMHSILEMALKHESWDVVEWILENIDVKMLDIKLVIQSVTKYSKSSKLSWILDNFDHKLIDLQSMMTSACTFDNISLVRSMIDRFGIEMFQSRHTCIMKFAIRNLRNGCSDIVKLCLKNPLNIGEYNMIELFNMACRHNGIELIEWLLVHCDHVHFNFNSAFTETLKGSGYYPNNIKDLKLLLIKLDHTFLDIESIIQNLCRKGKFDMVMWMLNTFDPYLVDIRSVMSMACQNGSLHLVQCIIRQYRGIKMFTIESLFDDACKSESSSLLEWLYQNFENSHICNLNNFRNYSFRNIIFLIENRKINTSDYNAIFNHFSQTLYSDIYMEFLTCLFDTMDHMLFDLKLVFNHVCRYGTTDFVKWMVKAFDNTLFDFQSAILEAVKNDNFELVTFLLRCLFDTMDHGLFDLKLVFNHVCRYGTTDYVKWMVKTFDNTLFDLQSAILEAVKNDNFELVTFLLIPVRPNVDMNSVFLEACYHSNVQLVNLLLDTFDHIMFSVSEGISRSCSQCGCEKFIMNLIERCKHNLIDFNIVIQAADDEKISFTFVQGLMEIADNSKVDVPFVMHHACNRSHPDWDFVKFMLTTYDYKVDMKLIFNSACRTGTPEIVKWLLDDYGRGMFDLKSGFNEACCEGRLDIVKLLVGSVGTENFDLQSAVQLTMNKDKIDVFLQSDEIVQPSVFDLQYVMDKMCPTGNTVFVKWLIESFDCSKLDLNSTIGRIFDQEHHCLNVLELLLQYFGLERFDMTSIIIQANHKGYREVISMMIKTVDHSFFDMKTVLLEICKEGNLETVMNLIETWHCKDLVDEAFILKAFRTGSSDIVKWLLHQRKEEIIDTKTAMSNACIGGHTQLVQYLLAKNKMDNVKHFDLRSAINAASDYGRTEVVQLFLQKFHYETFDMDAVMCHARVSGHIGLVKWLLGVYDHEIFNIESSVIEDVKNEMAEFQKKRRRR